MLWFFCRFGLLAQALMMMVTVGSLFRDDTIFFFNFFLTVKLIGKIRIYLRVSVFYSVSTRIRKFCGFFELDP
jgi:hypothetical protein